MLWAAYWAIRTPDAGLLRVSGQTPIRLLDLEDTQPGKFNLGDTLLSINGVPLRKDSSPLAGARVGDVWQIEVADPQGVVRTETVILAPPLSWAVLVYRFAPLLVAVVFWMASVTTMGLTRSAKGPASIRVLFFAVNQLVAVLVSTIHAIGSQGGDIIPTAALATFWLGTLAIHLHFHFPVRVEGKGLRWVVLTVAYGVAVAGTLVIIGMAILDDAALTSYGEDLLDIGGVWVVLCIAIVILLLIAAMRKHAGAPEYLNTRLVSLFAVIGTLPMLVLALVPQALDSPYALSIANTILPFGIVPIGYSYAILRYRLIQYDGLVSRGIGYLVAIVILATLLVAAVIGLLSAGVAPSGPGFVVGLVALAALLSVAFEPARRRIQDSVDRLFYRPYDDFRATLRQVDLALSAPTDVAAWAQALCQQFASALNVTPVGLLFRVGKAFRLIAFDPNAVAAPLAVELDALSPLFAQLAAWAEPCTSADLRTAVERPGLSEPEGLWLATPAFDLWWPILAHGALQAVLVLGPRASAFAPEEVELVALASRQIGAALENAQFAHELEQLSRAALQTREDERKRVSRELHDHIIQPLVGLNFSLASARDIPAAAEARAQVADLITHVRRISADLRPPALDEVGLPAAARGLVRGFARQTGLVVDFVVRPDEDLEVPEPLASALFSALREALSNVERHAKASRVSVLIEAQAGWLTLVVHDDGVGFTPPARLGQLAPAGHFGLLGLQERLAALGGSLALHAEPDQGTRLECHAPLLS